MIVIAGSTGVGKTDLALQIGNELPIEIVNADLGQFYQPLSIGTAKPLWQESPIKHHLFDIFTTPQSSTVVEFRSQLLLCLQDIWSRNKIPVIVGGSTFYVESIFFKPVSDVSLKHQLLEVTDDTQLWNMLHEVDPQRAQQIHPNDTYRLKQGLMLWNATGIQPSLLKPIYDPPSPYLFLYLTRDRDDLYDRINKRVMQMLDSGWIDEVRGLMNTPWQSFVQTKKFIGYPELIEYLCENPDADISKNNLKLIADTIAQKTRNYAKRQETYWKRLEKKLSHCLVTSPGYTSNQQSKVIVSNLTSLNLDIYSKQLCAQLYTSINNES